MIGLFLQDEGGQYRRQEASGHCPGAAEEEELRGLCQADRVLPDGGQGQVGNNTNVLYSKS